MPINLKALQRTFDLATYLKTHDPGFKVYGPNFVVRDPKCGKDQKLWVLTQDKSDGTKAGAYICYYCNEGGATPLSLVKRIEDCDTFDAIAILVAHQKGTRPLTDLRMLVQDTLFGVGEIEATRDDTDITPVPLPDEFIRYTDVREPPAYFAKRGIDIIKARRYGLGFCTTGYFANRLVVPVSQHGKQLFFVARWMETKPPAGVKKTLYPKGSRPNRVLFNYDRAKDGERIVIVEDVFSAMHVGKHAVASFGTQFSQYQLELLMRTAAQEIVLMWDRDAITKAYELAKRLAEFWRVSVVELPDIRDPDEFPRKELAAMMSAAPVLDPSGAFRAHVVARLA